MFIKITIFFNIAFAYAKYYMKSKIIIKVDAVKKLVSCAKHLIAIDHIEIVKEKVIFIIFFYKCVVNQKLKFYYMIYFSFSKKCHRNI